MRNLRLEQFPNHSRDVLARRNFSRQFRHFVIQVAMIHPVHHFPLQNILQLLQIQHHSRRRVRLARDRHFQHVIVPVAVRIIALAEDAAVLLRREIRVVVEMRRRKFDFARDSNHVAFAGIRPALPYHRPLRILPPRNDQRRGNQASAHHIIFDVCRRVEIPVSASAYRQWPPDNCCQHTPGARAKFNSWPLETPVMRTATRIGPSGNSRVSSDSIPRKVFPPTADRDSSSIPATSSANDRYMRVRTTPMGAVK